MLQFNEVLEILMNELETVERFAYEDFDHIDKLGKIERVHKYGGEGQGECWYKVFYFEEHDMYIRVDGFYTSYNGTEFYDGWKSCKEVKPIERIVTFYE
jgi:hypothetical protein